MLPCHRLEEALAVSRSSIIIPVLGELPPFEDTLVSVLENRPDDCQVLAAFNRPYNDPYGLEGEVQFVLASPKAGMAGLVNAHRALPGAVRACARLRRRGRTGLGRRRPDLLRRPACRRGGYAAAVAQTPGRIVSAGIGCSAGGGVRYLAAGKRLAKQKAFYAPLGPDATAAFYRRSTLAALGGMPTDVGDELAGVELALRLQQAGYACALATECRLTYQKLTTAAGPLQRGWHAERQFWRWAAAYGWTPQPCRPRAARGRSGGRGRRTAQSVRRGGGTCGGRGNAAHPLARRRSSNLQRCRVRRRCGDHGRSATRRVRNDS